MTAIVRVALAQLASLPAYATPTVDFLREPAPPDYKGRTGGYLSPLRHRTTIGRYLDDVERSHLEDLQARVRAVLDECASQRVQLLVFPEYSIPVTELQLLKNAATSSGLAIVAGSHLVRNKQEALDIYGAIGADEIARDPLAHTRKAVAPVFLQDGTVVLRYKAVASKWESEDLVPHPSEAAPIMLRLPSGEVGVDVRICIEALAQPAPSESTQLLVVTALSPNTMAFDGLFASILFREIPSVLVNAAQFGGSVVRTAPTAAAGATEGLLRIAHAEEVLLIADIDLEAQFQKRGSAVAPRPVRLVTRKPFLFPMCRDHAELLELVRAQGASLPPAAAIASLAARTDLPESAREQLHLLGQALSDGTATLPDVRLLLDGLALPDDVPPFPLRCRQALEEANAILGEELREQPGKEEIIDAVRRVGQALDRYRGPEIDIVRPLPPIRSDSAELKAPFVDREVEVARLSELLRASAVVLARGLPGIGKATIARSVVRELYPNAGMRAIQCVPGMEARHLLNEIEERIGVDLPTLRALPPTGRRRVSGLLLVRDIDHCFGRGEHAAQLAEYLSALNDTTARVICLSQREVDGFSQPSIRIDRMRDTDAERIFDFHCKILGVEPQASIVSTLHGYPLAAKLAARLLRDGRRHAFDRLRFLRQIREEVVRVLLHEVTLTDEERRAVEALSVFRRPAPRDLRDALGLPELETALVSLERRFLLERDGESVFVTPLVREFAVEEWLRPSRGAAYHKVAAEFYSRQSTTGERVSRFEAREEAIYHLSSLGRFDEARSLGADWIRQARAACRDLYERRMYAESLGIAEKALVSHPQDAELLGRVVLAAAHVRDWTTAARRLAGLRREGIVPAPVLTGYGDALAKAGIISEADAILEEACETYPDNAYAWAARAQLYLTQNKLEEARECAAQAVTRNPHGYRGLEVASNVARRLGNCEEAFRLAKQAMGIRPTKAVSTNNIYDFRCRGLML